MTDFIPHTDEDVAEMLEFLGLRSTAELFAAVPEALRLAGGLGLGAGLAEGEVHAMMAELASANRPVGSGLVCFAGGGAYDHEVPSVVRALAGQGGFVTSYTPYQPEVSQGVLQALFEYQTMVARLAGLPVANASLYDGAAALVEAMNLAAAATGRDTLWVSQGVNPRWRDVARTMCAGKGRQLTELRLKGGATCWPEPQSEGVEPPAAVVVAYPNYLGCLEDLDAARGLADSLGALLVVAFDPLAASLLRSPGDCGADVAVGEGQALGIPLGFGGPYLGLFACSEDHLRRLPGRLVGRTVDSEGTTAYVSTLRAREQDIRRERASSNVCTNQTLMAVTAAVQLGWLGTAGLREVALRCARGTRYCRDALLSIDGVEPATTAPVLREMALRAPVPAEVLVERLADEGFLAGVPVGAGMEGSGAEGALLVAVTERRTRGEIDAYVAAFAKAAR